MDHGDQLLKLFARFFKGDKMDVKTFIATGPTMPTVSVIYPLNFGSVRITFVLPIFRPNFVKVEIMLNWV
jgi:hypothetical protein